MDWDFDDAYLHDTCDCDCAGCALHVEGTYKWEEYHSVEAEERLLDMACEILGHKTHTMFDGCKICSRCRRDVFVADHHKGRDPLPPGTHAVLVGLTVPEGY